MKKWGFTLFVILFSFSIVNAIPNPAAFYCNDLGYNYKIVKTTQGEVGYCTLPDKSECEEWNFFSGKCGKKYSYCIKHGYDLITKNDGKNSYSKEYAVCVDKQKEIGMITDLMNFDQRLIATVETVQGEENLLQSEATSTPPSYFDWRNVNGSNWMTSVKNQGSCGSCWDFAAVGAVEGDANIEYNNSTLGLDLSEQDVLSCSIGGSCSGGYSDYALRYIKDTGVVDESCFPYTASSQYCSNKCSDWQTRVFKIANYGYIPYPRSSNVKNYLINSGPIVTYLYMGGYFSNGIYRCSYNSYPNHAVVLVGYNDTGNYWILKNSWGNTWNGDGYFKLAYGNCSFTPDCYVDILPDIIPPAAVTDLSVLSTKGASAILGWTASGDDEMIGSARYYDIAYSTDPITENNFDSLEKARSYAGGSAGTRINGTVKPLFPETTYYFAMKAFDEYNNPSNLSSVVIGTTTTGIVLFDDNIEIDTNGWDRSWVVGWNETLGEDDPVLWHITEHKSTSPTHSWYYGIEEQWNYNTGTVNNGSLITPIIDITNYSDLYMILKYSADLEPQEGHRYQDSFSGSTVIDGQKGGGGMVSISFNNRSTSGEFIKRVFQLDHWGNTLRISFDFDSMDELYNYYEGIYLDDIKIIADGYKPVANTGGPYVNGSGYTITFDGSGSYDLDGDTLTYSWDFGDNNWGYEKIVTHTYSNPGIYTVSLLVNDRSSQSEHSYTTANILWMICTDSDNGLTYTVKGTVSGYNYGVPYSYTDYCNYGTYVGEYWCQDSNQYITWKNCRDYGSNWFCNDGKCYASSVTTSIGGGGGGGGGGKCGGRPCAIMWGLTLEQLTPIAILSAILILLTVYVILKFSVKKV